MLYRLIRKLSTLSKGYRNAHQRVAALYGTRPISTQSTASVSRLLGQLLTTTAAEDRAGRVVAACPGQGEASGVQFLSVELDLAERALGKLSRWLSKILPALATMGNGRVWARKATRQLSRSMTAPQVVLCATTPAVIEARRRWKASKLVYWVHSLPSIGGEQQALAAIESADVVVVPSRAIYQAFWQLYNRKAFPPALWVIPNWVDTRLYLPPSSQERSSLRRELGIQEDEFAIGHVGGAARHKGRHIVEYALRELASTGERPIVMLSAGDANLTEKRLTRGVRLVQVGTLQPHEMARLYGACDLGVAPSVWWENAPLAVIEMMASGLCVIASNAGGIPELIEHETTGLIVERPNEVAAWIEEMRRAIADDSLRIRLGRCAREAALHSFSGDSSLRKWRELIKGLAEQRV